MTTGIEIVKAIMKKTNTTPYALAKMSGTTPQCMYAKLKGKDMMFGTVFRLLDAMGYAVRVTPKEKK